MDIQTKDGIVLRGIPEGTPDEAIKARIAQIRGAPASESAPTQPPDYLASLKDEIANPDAHPGVNANEPSFITKKLGNVMAPFILGATVHSGESALNTPSSAASTVSNLVTPFLHPIETVKNIGNLAGGVLGKLGSTAFSDEQKSMADSAGNDLYKRLGTVDNIRNTIEKDPVGLLADVSGATSAAGGLAKLLGGGDRAAASVARVTDPFSVAGKTASALTKNVVEPLVSNTLGSTTGIGPMSIRENFNAGRAGGSASADFLTNLRGLIATKNILGPVQDAVSNLYQARSAAYKAGIGTTYADLTPLDLTPIKAAITKAEDAASFKGFAKAPSTIPTLDKIKAAFAEFSGKDPAEYHTAEGLDALKQNIGDIRDDTPYGSASRGVADDIYHTVKTQIVNQSPDYAKVMQDYSNATDELSELKRALSLGKEGKPAADTALRKLQSIMRNNANTNYGSRVEMGQALQDAGATNLFPKLAGQMSSAALPRGLQTLGPLAIAATAISHPWSALSLPLFSPRAVAEVVHKAGQSMKLVDALKQYGSSVPIDPTSARMLAVQLGRLDQQNTR